MLFVECNESARPYGLPSHRHLSEIEQELSNAAGEPVIIQFAPHLIPLNRGILTTIHADPVTKLTAESLEEVYETAYGSEWFIRLLGSSRYPDIKNVVGTNRLEIAWRVDPRTGRIILMSADRQSCEGSCRPSHPVFQHDERLGRSVGTWNVAKFLGRSLVLLYHGKPAFNHGIDIF